MGNVRLALSYLSIGNVVPLPKLPRVRLEEAVSQNSCRVGLPLEPIVIYASFASESRQSTRCADASP